MARVMRAAQERIYPMGLSEAWRLLADTDHLNRSIGLPSVEFSPLNGAKGELVREAHARAYGIVPVRWKEYPFDWVRERRYLVRREFEGGPLAVIEVGLELEPAQSGVHVLVYADFTPANFTGRILWRLGAGLVDRTIEFCDHYLRRRDEGRIDPVPVAGRPVLDERRLGEALAQLRARPVSRQLLPYLEARVREGADDQVLRLRAFAVAESWNADRAETLRLFLHAASAGLFQLAWQLMCPNCRVPKAQATSLATLPPQFHCDTCGITYDTALDRRVELRFSVHPRVRRASDAIYCIGGPLRMPHVAAQQFLRPGESRPLAPPLEEPLRLRAVGGSGELVVQPAPPARAAREISLIYAAGRWTGPLSLTGEDQQTLALPAGCSLVLRNQTAGPLLAVLEDLRWTDEAVTAAAALDLQEFRELFPAERPDPARWRAPESGYTVGGTVAAATEGQ